MLKGTIEPVDAAPEETGSDDVSLDDPDGGAPADEGPGAEETNGS